MSSWRSRNNNPQREQYTHGNNEMYTIGTMKAGTDRSLEDSISGYTPVMVDRRGNRRFHGAFTGGFSAGYYNTVGSAQGYKAKYDTWSSSRSNKNKQMVSQTPMDFMDDEDMATNTNLLMTSKSFNSLNNNSMNRIFNKTKSNVSNQLGDTMSDYLMVDKSTIFNHTKGIQLLKKCGWRTGTNIGDKSNITRLRLLLKKQDELLLNKTDNHSTNDLLFGDHILKTTNSDTQNKEPQAPHSTPLVSIYRPKMKTDHHGIGYDADTEDNRVDNHVDATQYITSGQKRTNPNKSAFGPLKKKRKLLPSAIAARHGLSALEQVETGDDIYGDEEHAPHIGYNTFIAHSDEEDHDADDADAVLMDDKQTKHMRKQAKQIYPHTTNTQHKHNTDHRARGKDGTLPIDGFAVASMDDHYQYNLKQQLQNHSGSKHHNFSSECIQFKSNKMEIDATFVHKFANIDLSVGSYLCRSVSHNKRTASKVWSGTASIPQHVPDAQRVITPNVSQKLESRFTAEETIVNDVTMNGLRAGLTLSEHIPGKKQSMRKADTLLNDIRSMFGNESADKLLRFDVFVADKLGIESAIDTDNNILFEDGNKTKFELDKEQFEFEEKWKQLQKYEIYLYPNKPRLKQKKCSNDDVLQSKHGSKMTAQEAAQCNRYGSLTRKIEMWIPDRLLCKRCNIRDPFLGMKDEEQTTKPLCESVSNKSYHEWMESKKETITSKGEQVAAMLEDTQTKKEPPILQLKQLQTWNAFLQETKHKKETDHEQTEKKIEMKHFIDGIFNDSDPESSDNEDNEKRNIDNIEEGNKKEMSLFKSIFEDNVATESDTEQSESEEDEDKDKECNAGLITALMPPAVKDREQVHVTKKHMEVKQKIEEEEINPRARKKFKFVAKSERNRNESKDSNKFGFIGVDKERRNRKNINMNLVQMEHESEEYLDDEVQHEVKPKDEETNHMIWTVIDNGSSSDSSDANEGRHKRRKKKRKKHKEKSSKKKAKHKKKKRSRHKY